MTFPAAELPGEARRSPSSNRLRTFLTLIFTHRNPSGFGAFLSLLNIIQTYHFLLKNVKSMIHLSLEIILVLARYGNVIIFGGALC